MIIVVDRPDPFPGSAHEFNNLQRIEVAILPCVLGVPGSVSEDLAFVIIWYRDGCDLIVRPE